VNEAVDSFAIMIEQNWLNFCMIAHEPMSFFLPLLSDLPLLFRPPLVNKTIIHNKIMPCCQWQLMSSLHKCINSEIVVAGVTRCIFAEGILFGLIL
jgi:hypothetical protein